jgi:hypothetical protein
MAFEPRVLRLTPLTALANCSHVGEYSVTVSKQRLSRRGLLKTLAGASSGFAVIRWLRADLTMAQDPASGKAIEAFTGPSANSHWNSVGPYVTEPQKVPLILLTDRPVQLETPRHYLQPGRTNMWMLLCQTKLHCGISSLSGSSGPLEYGAEISASEPDLATGVRGK